MPLTYPFDYENLIANFSNIIDFSTGYILQKVENPKEKLTELLSKFPAEENFYTDGSKIGDRPVGAASFAYSQNSCIKIQLPYETSIFTAEAVAIREILKYILEQELKVVNILTDSQSVLKSLYSLSIKEKSYIIYEIRDLLMHLQNNGISVQLIWIPSHKGITGNELADSLAKDAISTGEKIDFKLPYSDLNSKLKDKFNKLHVIKLKNIDMNKGNYYFDNFFRESNHTWFKNSSYTRRHIVSIIRLRTNHHSLQESLYRKDIVTSPICTFCNTMEGTIDHLLWVCPEFSGVRPWLITNIKKIDPNFSFNSIDLLVDPNSPKAKILVDFIINKCKALV